LGIRDNKDQAEKDLKKLRDRNDVSAELEQLNDEAVAARAQSRVTMMNMFSAPLLWPLVLAIFMMISQQLSGINAAMFYSNRIFLGAGLTTECMCESEIL
jgi:SP family facilitated glucose transporter-like MFS transporter 1